MDLLGIYGNIKVETCNICKLPSHLLHFKQLINLNHIELSSLQNIISNLPDDLLTDYNKSNIFINIIKLAYKHMHYDMDNYIITVSDEDKIKGLVRENINEQLIDNENEKKSLTKKNNDLQNNLNLSEENNKSLTYSIKHLRQEIEQLNHTKNTETNLLKDGFNTVESKFNELLIKNNKECSERIDELREHNEKLIKTYELRIKELNENTNHKLNESLEYNKKINDLYFGKKSSNRGKIGELNMELLCPSDDFAYHNHGQTKGIEGDGYYFNKDKPSLRILGESKDYGKNTHLGEKDIEKFKRDLDCNHQYLSGIFVGWNHTIPYENIKHGEIRCYNGKYALYICNDNAKPSDDEIKLLINLFYKFTEQIYNNQKKLDDNKMLKIWNKYIMEIKSNITQKKENYEKEDKIIKQFEKNLNDMKSQLQRNHSLDTNLENIIEECLSFDILQIDDDKDDLDDDLDYDLDDDNKDNLEKAAIIIQKYTRRLIVGYTIPDPMKPIHKNIIAQMKNLIIKSDKYCETQKTLMPYLENKGIKLSRDDFKINMELLGFEIQKKYGKSKIKELENIPSRVDKRHESYSVETL